MSARDIARIVVTNLRAAFKRFLAWLRGEPLIDVRLLPEEIKAALRPFLRPTVRYLSVPQAQQLIEAACALLASCEQIFARQIAIAKTEASLEIANAMVALAYQPGERLPVELERQLAGQRAK